MAASTPSVITDSSADNRRLLLIALTVVLFVVVPIGVSVGMSWVDMPWSDTQARSDPEWLAMPQLRATTADGTAVRARVALDVPSPKIKAMVQRSTQQVGLLLEVSVASHTRAQLGSAEGIRHLSDDMRERLNAYLGVDDAVAVRSVAIQDLLVKPQ